MTTVPSALQARPLPRDKLAAMTGWDQPLVRLLCSRKQSRANEVSLKLRMLALVATMAIGWLTLNARTPLLDP